jgi:phospholipid/cholesterol/gamma-HCH transport system ATP-binding protein
MIQIQDIRKQFAGKPVLKQVDLDIPSGKTTVIIGKSGCGKTVLLKSIIGLIKPDRGRILVDGEDIVRMRKKELYGIRKRFGMLFQGAALFDSMTVEENVGLPLREHTPLDPAARRRKVEEKLEMVGLPHLLDKKPSELSGGMKKRVGLARALVMEPEYLLYDEPTTGLDPITADTINRLIVDMNRRLNITAIAVTHDMASANVIGDRVAMLHEGSVYFDGTLDEFNRSKNPIVRRFREGSVIEGSP